MMTTFESVQAVINEAFGVGGPGEESAASSYDHESPGTHEDVQAESELGASVSEDAPKKAKRRGGKATKKSAKKAAKKAAKKGAKKAKGPKKAKAAKEPKTPKAKAEKKPRAPARAEGVTQKRGVPLDGSPRKAQGTNPPKNEEAAKYGRKIAKARKAMGLSQKALAVKAGLSQPGICNIERGVGGATGMREKSQATRAKLEKILGL
jgi:ribosome-binding protein aMBF1 (putative translation factor)